jgi:hypothetical protein
MMAFHITDREYRQYAEYFFHFEGRLPFEMHRYKQIYMMTIRFFFLTHWTQVSLNITLASKLMLLVAYVILCFKPTREHRVLLNITLASKLMLQVAYVILCFKPTHEY